MSASRGMSEAQARMLASDPRTTPGVLARLANDYPDVWSVLLLNPSVSAELRSWIETSIATADAARELELSTTQGRSDQPESGRSAEKSDKPDKSDKPQKSAKSAKSAKLANAPQLPKPPQPARVARPRRARRRVPAGVVAIAILVPPLLIIAALFGGVTWAFEHREVVGTVTTDDLSMPDLENPTWRFDLSDPGLAECMQYSFQTFAHNQGLVLVQNDISKEDCRNQDKPSPTLMSLIDTQSGQVFWSVNLADELPWTKKWHASLVNAVGLDQILVKYTDTNGSDAGSEKKSVDDTDDRKMKSVVPYNPLNGRVSDSSMATMKDAPIIQAPVIQVMQLPGDARNILIMSNGSDKAFRYARYRAKNLTKADWSYESDLKPAGGDPIVGRSLVLGRDDEDDPLAVNIDSGNVTVWAGDAGGKIFDVAGTYIHVAGDGTGMTLSNIQSQGGKDGHDITVTAFSTAGTALWSATSRGYALTTYAPESTLENRRQYSGLYLLDGDENRHITRLNPESGESVWAMDVPADSFEISRLENADIGMVYLTHEGDEDTTSMSFMNLHDGSLATELPIASSDVRVDGQTTGFAYWVDEPDRTQLISDAENGRSTSHDGDDKSDESRACVGQFVNATAQPQWSVTCNGNEHVFSLGGQWMLLDRTPQHQELIPLSSTAGDK